MGKVFLSYAEEDSEVAVALANRIRAVGVDVYYWQDPSQRGTQWISTIEREINQVSVFLAIMSPHFIASPWCTYERGMALRRAAELKTNGMDFILVAQVKPVEYLKAGFMGNFDWYGLMGIDREGVISKLMEKIKTMASQGIVIDETSRLKPKWPTFQNRDDELNDLIGSLTNISGERFFLLLAGPQVGKSWLINELPIRLAEKDQDRTWKILRVDLREQTTDVRSNGHLLLWQLFGFQDSEEDDKNIIEQISRKIARSNAPWLLLLDSAELLAQKAAKDLRALLSAIHEEICEAGNSNIRLAFVAASRSRFRAWRSVIPAPRFNTISLTHFDKGVIEEALREMATHDERDFDQRWYQRNAAHLYEVSEGLPLLLVKYMQWIRDNGYLINLRQLRSKKQFRELASPYIEKELLSSDSLLPFSADVDLAPHRREALEFVLLQLSPYRLITESHLKRLDTISNYLSEAASKTGWNQIAIWNALAKSHIIDDTPTLFRTTYPAMRRLLFRYKYVTKRQRIESHQQASEYMQGWWEDVTGTDKGLYLIECLWHYVESVRLTREANSEQMVLDYTEDLFQAGIGFNHDSVSDLAEHIQKCLWDDSEMQYSLGAISAGLFEKVLQIVEQSGDAKEV